MAVLPLANYPVHNPDGQVFKSREGLNSIILDFKKKGFTQNGEFTSLDLSFLQRGDFHYITHQHVLWVLKQSMDIPADWEKNKNGGMGDKTPVMILFFKGKREYTLTYGDLKFKNQQIVKADPWGFYSRWYDKIEVFVPNMRGRSHAFIPTVSLWDFDQGSAVKIQAMTGLIQPILSTSDVTRFVPSEPTASPAVTSTVPPAHPTQDVIQWYQNEVKILNAKAKDMPDKELNQAMEKLTADYNRKLLAIMAAMPDLSGITSGQEQQKPARNPHEVWLQHGGLIITFDVPARYTVVQVEQQDFNNYEVFLSEGASIKIQISKYEKRQKDLKITSGQSFEYQPTVERKAKEQFNFTFNAIQIKVEEFAEVLNKTIRLSDLPSSRRGHS